MMEHSFSITELADVLHRCIAAANLSDADVDLATIAVTRLEQAAVIVHGYRRMPHWPADDAEYVRCQFDVSEKLAAAAYHFMDRVRVQAGPW